MRHLMGMIALMGVGALAGCGGKGLGTVPVTGVVTYRGEPVDGASVLFSPSEGGRAASGVTDAEGRFALTTLSANDGALPGSYQVGVSKTVVSGTLSAEEFKAYREKYRGAPPPVVKEERLPVKYKQVATSGLTAEVTAHGKNHFTFELQD